MVWNFQALAAPDSADRSSQYNSLRELRVVVGGKERGIHRLNKNSAGKDNRNICLEQLTTYNQLYLLC